MKNYVKPKKHLGQHFLVNMDIAFRIVESLTFDLTAKVIEVGPGKGILTDYLFNKWDKQLVCIDIDKESIAYLKQKYPQRRDQIIYGDFLNTPIAHLQTNLASKDHPVKVIGNFPYNISSQIFFHILDHKEQVNEVVGMVQKEVAERLAASPGTRKCGVLTILLHLWYDVELLFNVSANEFHPPPKVESTLIRIKRNERRHLPVEEKALKRVVKSAFNNRRKTLRNALKSLSLPQEIIATNLFDKRAEELSLDDFIFITQQLNPFLNN